MSKLNIDQKAVKTLFSDKKADFLIPDYQSDYYVLQGDISKNVNLFIVEQDKRVEIKKI